MTHAFDDLYAIVQFDGAGVKAGARRPVRRVHGPFADEAAARAYAAQAGLHRDETSVTRLRVAVPPWPAGWSGTLPSPRRATP